MTGWIATDIWMKYTSLGFVCILPEAFKAIIPSCEAGFKLLRMYMYNDHFVLTDKHISHIKHVLLIHALRNIRLLVRDEHTYMG